MESQRPSNNPTIRPGMTMVEVLVSMAIIGLLMAVLTPAVQYARESARRIQCCNHLKQIITACHDHLETHRTFPLPIVEGETWRVRVLPFLEQLKPVEINGQITGGADRIPIYGCPSDPYAFGIVLAAYGTSYFPNDGHGLSKRDGFYRTFLGGPVQPRDISDGLSNTAAFSERRAGLDNSVYGSDFSNEVLWHHRVVRKTSTFIADRNQFADECENQSVPPLINQFIEMSYNTIQTPNRHSCRNGDTSDPRSGVHAAITASSLHSGGVNLALADGSVRFISDSIDRKVWRALGTRNGGESLGSDF